VLGCAARENKNKFRKFNAILISYYISNVFPNISA
jgi:hypothetical protein